MKFIKRFGSLLFCSDISTSMYTIKFIKKVLGYLTGIIQNGIKDKFIEEFKACVLKQSINEMDLKLINDSRIALCKKNSILENDEHGAGSRINIRSKTIANTVNRISVSRRNGRLLYNLAKFQKPDFIIELGTAFGISTLYMSFGWPSGNIITIEGSMQLVKLAEKNFSNLGIQNISVFNNSFDEILPQLKIVSDKKYMVYVDGNHTYEATMRYYNKFVNESAIIVFDDITWSTGMIDAWNEIKKSPLSGCTIDLFNTGIIFPNLKKSNYILWYH